MKFKIIRNFILCKFFDSNIYVETIDGLIYLYSVQRFNDNNLLLCEKLTAQEER